MTPLRAPFPYFGAKYDIADLVWSRFGDVPNYIEPFFGTGAVLLRRPHKPHFETINDKDHLVANFWRAIKHDPDAVAWWADDPINETDLHARHLWLITEGARRLAAIEGDPKLYDVQVAGWWVWGLSAWIGGEWCSGRGPWVWRGAWGKRQVHEKGVKRTRPHLTSRRGIHRRKSLESIRDWMRALADRLRHVRVCAGDWSRVCTPAATVGLGLTAVFLDPPYADTAGRDPAVYACDSLTVAHEVREWAIENGRNPLMRICLCGYDGEHEMPDDWETVAWKAHGGYSVLSESGRGRSNAHRERLWFSPACLKSATLLDLMEPKETVAECC